MLRRKRIQPDEKVPLQLDDSERKLILRHTFAASHLTDRLRIVPRPGESRAYGFTLADLDELAGYVAAERRHTKDQKLKKPLGRIFDRIQTVLETYTEEEE